MKFLKKLQVHFPNEIGIIHSNKSQNYRLRSVQNFDTGVFRLLIATDLIARGLDFKSVSHVINIGHTRGCRKITFIVSVEQLGRKKKA